MHETNRRGGRVNVFSSFVLESMCSYYSRNFNGQCCISKCGYNAT